MDVVSILQIGAVGLGFLLAFLAYKLLIVEQRRQPPRKQIITAIYVFMFFSVCLVALGGMFKALPEYLQHLKESDRNVIEKNKLTETLAGVRDEIEESQSQFETLTKKAEADAAMVTKLTASKCQKEQCIKSDGSCGRVRIFSEIFYAEAPNKGRGAGLSLETVSADGELVVGSGMSSSSYGGTLRVGIRGKWVCE